MINANQNRDKSSTRHRLAAAALASTLVIAGLIIGAPRAAAEPECLRASYDFDGDYRTDPVIGAPGASGRSGTVQVRITNEDREKVVRLQGPNGFGSSVGQLSSYVNEGDDRLCSQLVVGSPQETVDGKAAAGAVYVYAWDGDEFVQRGRYTQGHDGVPGTAQAGARFGATVASATRLHDEVDPRSRRLYVGAPGQDVSSVADAGSVTSFRLGTADRPAAEDGKIISYASAGVPGAPTPHGALGAALSVSHGVVAIGAPGQAVGGVAAGAALIMAEDDAAPFAPRQLSQSTSGVPGSSERGDRFGAAIELAGQEGDAVIPLVVGVPGEDLSSVADAGSAVNVPIRIDSGAPVPVSTGWNQDSSDLAGTAEAGDAFGSAITSVLIGDNWEFIIGIPGEDINGHRDAGMVQVIGDDDFGLSQSSSGIPGGNENGDRFGAALAGGVIGVPGENAGSGAVIYRGPAGDSDPVRWLAPSTNADRYGSAVAP
ncbi:hypothetical protein [Microlunatus soli]|uniref:FG-GAP repeat-containing protein n=1 Tax=Microlunatus soli TaxID=630515 RepID=A0A1H1Z569_9ACTN|nr:hypothetical protein [Microlunatus soli]SDT28901.1 hypothetical protein SAMN04489812_4994 [Microlunatus soli]